MAVRAENLPGDIKTSAAQPPAQSPPQPATQPAAQSAATAEAPARRRARVHTRAALLDAAEAIFAERGAPTATIDEICSRAGFTRGAFYSNFRTVTDVFFALYERKTADLLSGTSRFEVHLAPGSHSADALERFVSELLAVIPADTQWYALRALFGLRATTDPELAEVLRQHGEEFQRGITPLLERIAGALNATLAPTADEAARVIIAAHVGSVLQGPFVDDPERLRHAAVLAALRGVLRTA
ncbi:TetR/AcrR family transcriptional regulator [Leucobacter aridicollis]|uniref:TetR/AcrR family transcriptional regulator n=1 Tax=Leucobacter aridicollis TaxID=283878 RepID=UPI002103A39E|nr:TetR/AcrR family transcriptional regulator [Leucobacter aridicollis]UTX54301.1 TetR/AcrR family transcriptional regulator [Leucobacter aridicollis]